MSYLIDKRVLYKQTAEWEAQALAMVEKTMHDEDPTEWRRWSAVLTERTAFKHDVADAPTVEPTLYGYKIEHLALIARVMEKDGVTPETAVQIFKDVQTIVLKIIDEISGAVERAFEQAMETGNGEDNEQTD